MTFLSRTRLPQRGLFRAGVAIALCVASASCHHIPGATEEYYRPDPISIHVESENFLDANVAIVVGGVTRRLGTVIGNTKATYSFPWNNALMSGVVMTATVIGGEGTGRSVNLSVSPGQVIEFKIAAVLRQTYATVHDP